MLLRAIYEENNIEKPIFLIYIFMAESAELADKLQGSVCRLVLVSVNFQVCD